MSNTNWSKGPWTFDKYRNAKDGNGNALMAEGVSIPCGHSKEEVEANMNLFIASPDLYSALELMTKYCALLEDRLLDNRISVSDIYVVSKNEQPPEDVAECALAKARGEQ